MEQFNDVLSQENPGRVERSWMTGRHIAQLKKESRHFLDIFEVNLSRSWLLYRRWTNLGFSCGMFSFNKHRPRTYTDVLSGLCISVNSSMNFPNHGLNFNVADFMQCWLIYIYIIYY